MSLSSAERLLMFLGITHLNLNICLDVGHAHMNEGVETAYRLLKSRIRSTHVHDNNGKEDLHLFPLQAGGQGTIDWRATMQLLAFAGGSLSAAVGTARGAGHGSAVRYAAQGV